MKNFVDSVLLCIVLICVQFTVKTQAGGWEKGHATFYLNARGAACGYNANWQGYGDQISAVSETLLGGRDGAQCGACYQIICVDSPNCYPRAGAIRITVTDFCPSSSGPAAWCNPPQKHFDLSVPMFIKLAPYKAGIVPVAFRRVPCAKAGGVRFTISQKTNPYWLEVLVSNVGGDGVVAAVHVKGSKTGWMSMKRNWGQNWDAFSSLGGQSLSFQVTTSDRKTLFFNGVVSASWRNGQTFEGRSNF